MGLIMSRNRQAREKKAKQKAAGTLPIEKEKKEIQSIKVASPKKGIARQGKGSKV